MKDVFSAEVRFLSREEGGRNRSPFERWELREGQRLPPAIGDRSGHYLPDARFDDLPHPPDVVYGLFIEWISASEDGLRCHMQFAFRADESGDLARQLHRGSRFQLFEGRTVIATGRINDGPFESSHMLVLGL